MRDNVTYEGFYVLLDLFIVLLVKCVTATLYICALYIMYIYIHIYILHNWIMLIQKRHRIIIEVNLLFSIYI